MPRPVDVHARRMEITNAAIRILARGGTGALTLRSLAHELGGSITLVTHFFANRSELFVAVTDELISTYDSMLDELDHGAGDVERLQNLLVWMVPTTADDREAEAGRIALISHREEHESIAHFFDAMETRMRSLLRERLVGLVDDDRVEPAVGFLRSMTNGLTLSGIEHPELWSLEQIETCVSIALDGLLAPSPDRAATAAADR